MGQVVPKNWPCSTCHQHVYMNQYKVGCMIVLRVSRITKEQIHTSMFKKSTDMATIVSHKDKNSSTLRGKDRLSYLGHVLGDILYVAMPCNSIWYPLLASQHVMKCWSLVVQNQTAPPTSNWMQGLCSGVDKCLSEVSGHSAQIGSEWFQWHLDQVTQI